MIPKHVGQVSLPSIPRIVLSVGHAPARPGEAEMSDQVELPDYFCPLLEEGPVGAPIVWLNPSSGKDPADNSELSRLVESGTWPDGSPTGHLPTAVRVWRTIDRLHLHFWCVDHAIWGSFTEHDSDLFDEEVVEAFLSPTGDARAYYEIEMSPRGTLFDAFVYSPDLDRTTMTVDRGWDAQGMIGDVVIDGTLCATAAEAAAAPPSRGWRAHISVPFAAFPGVARPVAGDVWLANFYRIDLRGDGEFDSWSPTLADPPNFHVPSRFGRLIFV